MISTRVPSRVLKFILPSISTNKVHTVQVKDALIKQHLQIESIVLSIPLSNMLPYRVIL